MLFANLEHAVPSWVTCLFALLLVGLILCLAFEEKLHAKKSVIAGLFAIICLVLATALNLLPFDAVAVGSHELAYHGPVEGDYLSDDELVHVELPAVSPDTEREANVTTSVDAPDSGTTNAGDHADEASEASPRDTDSNVLDHSADDGHGDASPAVHVGGHRISMPVYIPAIDWGVIAIIVGSSLFVDITSKSGLFTWIAVKVTKASKGDPATLLLFYGIMTVLFSAVLNNVTAMIIVGSLTAVSLDKLGRNDKLLGFLLIEGLLTNIGGLLTLISSVPNIIVGTAANISFVDFVFRATPFVVVATFVTIWMGRRMFGIERLSDSDAKEMANDLVNSFDENDGIESWGFFKFGVAMLILFILTIATTSLLPVVSDLQMGFVALAFAGIMLIRFKSDADRFYRAIDWDLIAFFMALFVIINAMEHARVLDWIGVGLSHVIGWGEIKGTAAILIASGVFSSVTDNIPLAAMLAKILTGLGTPQDSPLWWAVIFGANLGGNITPIGSASTLVAVTIIHRHKLPMTFGSFVKAALPFAIIQLAIAVVYVLLVLR